MNWTDGIRIREIIPIRTDFRNLACVLGSPDAHLTRWLRPNRQLGLGCHKLSKTKRDRYFAWLTDEERDRFVKEVNEAFEFHYRSVSTTQCLSNWLSAYPEKKNAAGLAAASIRLVN